MTNIVNNLFGGLYEAFEDDHDNCFNRSDNPSRSQAKNDNTNTRRRDIGHDTKDHWHVYLSFFCNFLRSKLDGKRFYHLGEYYGSWGIYAIHSSTNYSIHVGPFGGIL